MRPLSLRKRISAAFLPGTLWIAVKLFAAIVVATIAIWIATSF